MPQIFCSTCSNWLKGFDPSDDLVVFCPDCGKCLEVPTWWADKIICETAPKLEDLTTEAVQQRIAKRRAAKLRLPNGLVGVSALGQLLAAYRTERSNIFGQIIILVILLTGIIWLAYWILTSNVRHVPAEAPIVLIAGPFICVGAIFIGLKDLVFCQSVLVFSGGLVRLRFGKVHAFPWEQIAGVYQRLGETFASGRYYLRHQDGKKLTFHDLGEARQLRATIEQAFWQEIFPRKLREYEGGGIAEFGRFGVSQTGLTFRGKSLPWNKVARLGVDPQGIFSVSKQGGALFWAAAPAEKIPNFLIFRELVERHLPFTEYAS